MSLKYIKYAFTFIAVLFLIACNQENQVISPERLPKDSQTNIIDMNLTPSEIIADKKTTHHAETPHLDWDAPSNWKTIDPGTFAKVKYLISENLQLSISSFPGSAGGLLSNVNRWRQQLNLHPIKITELANFCSTLNTPFKPLTIVTLTDSNHANKGRILYVAIFDFNNEQWFIKVFGNRESFNYEYSKIVQFLKSIRSHG